MRPYLFLVPVLLLAACAPSRGEADKKLTDACAASVEAVFTDPKEQIKVQDASFSSKRTPEGVNLRIVTLNAQYIYGQSEPDNKTYTCAYAEEWSLFTYLAAFYSLQKGDQIIGNVGGVINGDTEILLKITEANQKILH